MKKKFLLLIAFLYAINLNAQDCWKAIAAGSQHTLAVKTDGTLWAWGWNSQGELGNGTTTSAIDPIQIGTASNWDKVTAGDTFSLAIKTDGTLWAWGDNSVGQLGLGNTTDVLVPTQVGTATWTEVEAGITKHVIGLRSNGTLWGWGHNFHGQLGVGDNLNKVSPTQIGSLTTWASLTAGNGFSLAIRTNGTLWAWGHNNVGQLGIGNTTSHDTPQQVGSATDWEMVSAGQEHTMGIGGGFLFVWGTDTNGNMGNGTSTASYSSPHLVNFDLDWAFVSAGIGCHAIKDDGSYWAWGNNSEGQLGLGNWNINILSPTMGGGSTMTLVSAKFLHTIVLRTDGAMRSCGNNDHYQLGINPDFSPNFFGFGPECPTPVGNVIVANDNTYNITSCQSVSFAQSILANDTFNGAAATTTNTDMTFSTLPTGITVNGGGSITISSNLAPGSHSFTYTLCDANDSTNCDTATVTINVTTKIIAENDAYTALAGVQTTFGTLVLNNDIYHCGGATLSNVNISVTAMSHPGVTLNTATGAVSVGAAVPPGTYLINYMICDQQDPNNCESATITVTVVQPAAIVANNDTFTTICLNGLAGGSGGDVTVNDTYNGNPVNDNNVTITVVNNGGITGLTINSQGLISIPANTPYNTYTITYQICQPGTTNCQTATATICVNHGLNPGGNGPNGIIYDIQVQSDGYILIGGLFTQYNGVTRNRIARLKPDLSLDTTFDPSGIGFNGAVNTIAIVGNKIVVGGEFTATSTGNPRMYVARLNAADGSLDTSYMNHVFYGLNGSLVKIIKPLSNGSVIVGGLFDKVDSQPGTCSVVKLTSTGAIATDFASPFGTSSGQIFDIHVYPDLSMLIGGYHNQIAANGPSSPSKNLYRLSSTGVVDTNFNPPNLGATGYYITSLLVNNTTGTITVGGFFQNYGNSGRNHLVQLNPNGSVGNFPMNSEQGFNWTTGNGPVMSLAYDQNNKILVGGHFHTYNGIGNRCLLRLNSTGSFDNSFTTGSGFNGPVHKVALHTTTNKILAGGNFTQYNLNTASFITRLVPTTNPVIQGRSSASVVIDDTIAADTEDISSIFGSSDITIYPNPSTGIFNLKFEGEGKEEFEIAIYNSLGQLLHQGTVSPETANQIDLSRFENGNYYIRLQNEQRTINKVVTKKQ